MMKGSNKPNQQISTSLLADFGKFIASSKTWKEAIFSSIINFLLVCLSSITL